MKILVLGSSGQLGKCLFDQVIDHEKVIFLTRNDLDICNFIETKRRIENIKPDFIINASAYTNVDNSEVDNENAIRINYESVLNLSIICKEIDCWLFHISTDYVFDGNSDIPYTEADTADPISRYGASKLLGENGIITSGCKYIILRTSWAFSEYGKNFLKSMLNLAKSENNLKIVNDQIGCPTYMHDVASVLLNIIYNSKIREEDAGIYHFCGYPETTWYKFANRIFEKAIDYNFPAPSNIEPINTVDLKVKAKRPKFSSLDCSKIELRFGVKKSNWDSGIKDTLNRLNKLK